MANNYISLKSSYDVARSYKENIFSNTQPVSYVFIGNSIPYDDENNPDNIEDTVENEKLVWNTIFAAKKIIGNDVEMVIPRINWKSGETYKQFDDTILLETLVTKDVENNINPMYVLNSDFNVYKCLCNNGANTSTIQPTGDYFTSNGFIQTSDGYLWKYMYNIRQSNKFLSDDWMPVPYNTEDLRYNLSPTNLVDGALAKIVTINGGTGYGDNEKTAFPFFCSTSLIKLTSIEGVETGMFVSGNGIVPQTFITNVNVNTNVITLSNNTIDPGGGLDFANVLTFSTRVTVTGDGNNDVIANPIIEDGIIRKIEVSSVGTNYTRATVNIFGSGNGAEARVVLPPKYGHGYNPAIELGSKYIMISQRIGETDSTENNLIDVDVSFRQYGILNGPHKYNEFEPVSFANSNTVVSQTYDLTVVSGETEYEQGEYVYQGNSLQNSTFFGYVHSFDRELNILKLINYVGIPSLGVLLKGNISQAVRPVILIKNPEFERYTGNILNVNNIQKVDRNISQSEEIKIVLKF
jgi:hypothetical protein